MLQQIECFLRTIYLAVFWQAGNSVGCSRVCLEWLLYLLHGIAIAVLAMVISSWCMNVLPSEIQAERADHRVLLMPFTSPFVLIPPSKWSIGVASQMKTDEVKASLFSSLVCVSYFAALDATMMTSTAKWREMMCAVRVNNRQEQQRQTLKLSGC